MAPAFQAVGNAQQGNGNSLSVVWPTHLANDIGLIVLETTGNGTTLTPPSGWVALPNTPVVDVASTAGSKLHVWWKRAASNNEGSVTTGAGTDHIVARIFTFRGCISTGDPWDVTTTGTKTTASTTATVPALTTTVNNTLIAMIVGRPDDSSSTTHFGVPVNTNLTGLAEGGEAGSVSGNGGGFVLSYGFKATAGNTGTSTLTKTASTTDTYVTLALKPEVLELISNTGTFNLTGTTTGLLLERSLIQQPGTYTVTGIDALLQQEVRINATAGTYDLTGINTDLLFNRQLVSQTGTFSIAGIDVILQYSPAGSTFTLDTIVGAYDLTGTTLTLNRESTLVNQTGTFSVVGNQLDFIRTLALNSVSGTFSIIGNDAALSLSRSFDLTTGTYSVGYVNSDFNRLYQLTNQVGTYQVNGSNLDYFSSRSLFAVPLDLKMRLQSNGDFFWYRTTQTIQPVKYKITKRNEWILGRATHMGRRGL